MSDPPDKRSAADEFAAQIERQLQAADAETRKNFETIHRELSDDGSRHGKPAAFGIPAQPSRYGVWRGAVIETLVPAFIMIIAWVFAGIGFLPGVVIGQRTQGRLVPQSPWDVVFWAVVATGIFLFALVKNALRRRRDTSHS